MCNGTTFFRYRIFTLQISAMFCFEFRAVFRCYTRTECKYWPEHVNEANMGANSPNLAAKCNKMAGKICLKWRQPLPHNYWLINVYIYLFCGNIFPSSLDQEQTWRQMYNISSGHHLTLQILFWENMNNKQSTEDYI